MGIGAAYVVTCTVGKWNDESHFGSAIGLVGQVGLARLGFKKKI